MISKKILTGLLICLLLTQLSYSQSYLEKVNAELERDGISNQQVDYVTENAFIYNEDAHQSVMVYMITLDELQVDEGQSFWLYTTLVLAGYAAGKTF